MRRTIVLLIFASLACLQFGCASGQSVRTAETIIAEYDAIKPLRFDWDREDDEQYVAEYRVEHAKIFDQKAALAWELYQSHPEHEKVPELVRSRWWWPRDDPERSERVLAEMRRFVDTYPAASELGKHARYGVAWYEMGKAVFHGGDVDDAMQSFEWYLNEIGRGEHDEETADLLYQMTFAFDERTPQHIDLLVRISEEFAGTEAAARCAAVLHQYASIGSAFHITFTCAITGRQVDTADMRGQVLLLDFWATWCGPCVEKMPIMMALHDRYRNEGLAIIGISLDMPEADGGLNALREFVADNDLPWPQWYLGEAWHSPFAQEWGISGIPTLFIIDRQGVLRDTTLRPDEIEEAVTAYLAAGQADSKHD